MTTSTPRRRAVAVLGLAAALALAACAPPGAASSGTAPSGAASAAASGSGGAAKTGTLKVGYISPTTGNFAVAGQEMVDGWSLYWSTNGAEVNGVKIETVVEDDAGNPETSLTKAKKLIEQDKVDVVVGPLLANTALAVAKYTSSVGIPNLHPVAASDDLTQRDKNDLTVRTGSMGGSQANYPGGVWAATKGGYKSVVTLCADYAFGWESCAGFVQGFTQNGGKITKQIWFPNSTTDFSTYVSQIQAANADLVFVATAGGAPGPNFLNAYNGLGLDKGKLLLNCCALDQGTLRAIGDQSLGIKSVSYWAEGRDSQANKAFNDAYKKFSNGKIPGAYVAGGYITAALVAQVIKEKGLLKGKELVSAITQYTYNDSIFGKVSWDYNNMVGPVYIREVKKVDGALYNVPLVTYEGVDQWLGRTPKDAMAQPVYSQSYQGLK